MNGIQTILHNTTQLVDIDQRSVNLVYNPKQRFNIIRDLQKQVPKKYYD